MVAFFLQNSKGLLMKKTSFILLHLVIYLNCSSTISLYSEKREADYNIEKSNSDLSIKLSVEERNYDLKDTLVFRIRFENSSNEEIEIYYHPYAIQIYRKEKVFHTGIQPIFPNVEFDNLEDALSGDVFTITAGAYVIKELAIDNSIYKIAIHPGVVHIYAFFRYSSEIDKVKVWSGSAISNTVTINFIE